MINVAAIKNKLNHIPSALRKANPFCQSGAVWVIECHVPQHAVDCFCEGLATFSSNYTSFAEEDNTDPETLWKLVFYCEEKPNNSHLVHITAQLAHACSIPAPSLSIALLPEHDWVSEVQRAFPPFEIGRYFVCSSQYEDSFPQTKYSLIIDASMAFGTGEHETTSGCLLALHRLAKRHRFTRMLDIGCGTGILAIAMAKTWKKPVLAVDIDTVAVNITAHNAIQNNVKHLIHTDISNGYHALSVQRHAPYELITSNILADPLISFAQDIKKNLTPGGIAVLSGLLITQENRVLYSHRVQGLRLLSRIHQGDWSTLIMQK